MVRKLFAAAVILGGLTAGPAKATVTYTFFDSTSPSTVDLDFTVAAQLSPTNSTEALLSTSGVFAADFTGGSASYLQGPPGFQPTIDVGNGNLSAVVSFDSFPFGDSANGVPGNGSFSVGGEITELIFVPLSLNTLANLGEATISGIPSAVPAPLIGFGFPTLLGVGGVLFGAKLLSHSVRQRRVAQSL
jgi:hypothetical protein